MNRAPDSRRVAEYRAKLSDPAYLAGALTHVAGRLAEMLVPRSEHNGHRALRVQRVTSVSEQLPREHGSNGDTSLYN